MTTRFVLLIAFVLALVGCDAGIRTSAPPDELNYHFTISHTMGRPAAFQASELWLAETFVSSTAVVDLKQPDNGLILAKPVITWWVGGEGIGAKLTSPYMLKLECDDRTIVMTIQLQPGKNRYGDLVYPPKSEMPKVASEFAALRESLAKRIK